MRRPASRPGPVQAGSRAAAAAHTLCSAQLFYNYFTIILHYFTLLYNLNYFTYLTWTMETRIHRADCTSEGWRASQAAHRALPRRSRGAAQPRP